jgi:hypothetical protein
MANVYLVRQDTEHLYGEYLESAVVIAESVHQARLITQQAVKEASDYNKEDIAYYPDRVMVDKIGNNGKLPDKSVPSVCCMRFGCNNYMPAGDYTPSKPKWVDR